MSSLINVRLIFTTELTQVPSHEAMAPVLSLHPVTSWTGVRLLALATRGNEIDSSFSGPQATAHDSSFSSMFPMLVFQTESFIVKVMRRKALNLSSVTCQTWNQSTHTDPTQKQPARKKRVLPNLLHSWRSSVTTMLVIESSSKAVRVSSKGGILKGYEIYTLWMAHTLRRGGERW